MDQILLNRVTKMEEPKSLSHQESNYSVLAEIDKVLQTQNDPQYEQFLADVWVGIILTLVVLSCVCCMCSCLLYHKFQQWKAQILQPRNGSTLENGNSEVESLPSYTIVSGLPSYDEALEQLKKVRELSKNTKKESEDAWTPHTPPTPTAVSRLSVSDLFQIYKNPNLDVNIKS